MVKLRACVYYFHLGQDRCSAKRRDMHLENSSEPHQSGQPSKSSTEGLHPRHHSSLYTKQASRLNFAPASRRCCTRDGHLPIYS